MNPSPAASIMTSTFRPHFLQKLNAWTTACHFASVPKKSAKVTSIDLGEIDL
jgi:hypothetical protein